MKGTTFAAYIRTKTKTNSTTFPDADIVTLANVVKDELAADIVANVDENYFTMELTRDLEAGERGYTLPDDILKQLTHVEVDLDGSGDYKPLLEADISQFDDTAILQEEEITDLYSGRRAEFLIRGRELIILSDSAIVDVTGGLKMLAEIYPEDVTASMIQATTDLSIPSSNTTHSLPRQVHKHWATKVVVEYKQGREKPIPLTEQEQKVDLELDGVYKKLTPRNNNRSFIAQVPKDNGQDY